ncbi:acyltransferase [Tenacibaculum caenipelagi]|uniref:Transferase family hexapeptide repeat protein n=1 Tax=Tenacibaculum caenipelagi TaxID=1325435 RepID=A0A4R6TGL8_9FLAO|nr:acyltransferase [Tenacibaculum caenipelagi]TDQ24102.1 transferase family hexapeptide repeat protein [Tenacibaculum caenipelagi]
MFFVEKIILKFHRLRFKLLYPNEYKKAEIHGPFSIIHPHKLSFGSKFSINDYAYINATNRVKVGDNVAISSGAKIISLKLNFTNHKNREGKLEHVGSEISIGNNVQIGVNAVVLPNVSICDNVIIGAGAVVSKDILESGIYVGIPAKKVNA